jgi:hypothetical protein
MGEFDVAVLIEQYSGKPLSKRMYPEWRGGYYYAAKPKPDPKTDSAAVPPLGLLYVYRWSSADKAAEFAAIYARSLKQRYKKADEVKRETPERPSQNADPNSDQLKGRHSWTTEEGSVVIEAQGDTVLVSENLDAGTITTLEKEVFSTSAVPK